MTDLQIVIANIAIYRGGIYGGPGGGGSYLTLQFVEGACMGSPTDRCT